MYVPTFRGEDAPGNIFRGALYTCLVENLVYDRQDIDMKFECIGSTVANFLASHTNKEQSRTRRLILVA